MKEHEFDKLVRDVVYLQLDKIAKVQLSPKSYGIDESIILKDSGKDYFTLVDEYIENLAREELSDILPGSGFIGEETEVTNFGARYAWMVDPIDGTAVYKLGGDNYASSIALLDHELNKVVLGSVYQPTRGRLFLRTPNALAIEVASGKDLSKLDTDIIPVPSTSRCFGEYLGCSFGSSKYYNANPGVKERVENVFSPTPVPDLKRSYSAKDARPASGSSNLFCCQIGAGERHFALLYFQKPWDLAVGALYARDAGCPVVLLDNDGNMLQKDLEQEIVASDKGTLLNVGVFANEHAMEYVLDKFKNTTLK